jgi:hypothetical protein
LIITPSDFAGREFAGQFFVVHFQAGIACSWHLPEGFDVTILFLDATPESLGQLFARLCVANVSLARASNIELKYKPRSYEGFFSPAVS